MTLLNAIPPLISLATSTGAKGVPPEVTPLSVAVGFRPPIARTRGLIDVVDGRIAVVDDVVVFGVDTVRCHGRGLITCRKACDAAGHGASQK